MTFYNIKLAFHSDKSSVSPSEDGGSDLLKPNLKCCPARLTIYIERSKQISPKPTKTVLTGKCLKNQPTQNNKQQNPKSKQQNPNKNSTHPKPPANHTISFMELGS